MSNQPFSFDPKGVLIEKLGEDSERFQLSNVFLKNGKGLTAIYEMRRLRSELYDFAKDPTIKQDQMKHLRPTEPKDLDKLSEHEQREAMEDYWKLMKEYELAQSAMKMQVPLADRFAIEQYMEPFEITIHATPAVKSRRFHALTKDPVEPQNKGLFGLGKGGPQG